MKVTLNMPDDPDGKEMEVAHLGLFKNGSTTDVDDDGQIQHWLDCVGLDKAPATLVVGEPPKAEHTKAEAKKEVKG